MLYIKENKGITLTALVVMIIVIMILAGITIYQGTGLIKSTKVETYVTNMITIRAKAKVYAEEVNAEVWDQEDKTSKKKELFASKYSMTEPSNKNEIISKVDSDINNEDGCDCYEITKDTLVDMGLNELAEETENGEYVVVYNSKDYKKLDIVYKAGINYEKVKYYTLSSLQKQVGDEE